MKKIFSSMLLLIAGAFIMTAQADSYQIWVGGVQVTDDNRLDINPAGKTAGFIKYLPDRKVLFCQDVTMSTERCCIDVEMEGVTVDFYGKNDFTSTNANTFYATKPVTLLGVDKGCSATFNCTSESKALCSLWFRSGGNLSILDLYLTLNSTHWALYGPDNTEQSAKLRTSTSEIRATAGKDYAAVKQFDEWEMSDNGRLMDGATYDTSSKKTLTSKGELASSVTLKNGLYVGAHMVSTSLSGQEEIKPGSGLTAGTITYDRDNKQLVLRDVKYESEDYSFIDNCNIDGLEILSIATNDITCKGEAMTLRSNTLLSSTGILRLTSTNSAAISTYRNCNVTVNMETLEAKGKTYGFFGQQGGTLTLKQFNSDAVYKFAGAEKGNVYTGNLVMDGMDIWTLNTYFHDNHIRKTGGEIAVSDNTDSGGTWFKSKSNFTYYPIYIAGTQVSSRNRDNILSPYITSGKVSYTPSTKTLTLDGVQMEATGDDAPVGIIINTKDETTLNFTGDDQNWTTSNDVILVAGVKGNLTITGDCNRVYLTSTAESGISTGAGTNITVNTSGYFGAKGATYGYYGGGATSDALTLHKDKSDNWGYVFEGAVGAIYNVKNLNLDNMDYSYNTVAGRAYGCYFDPNKEAVMQNGGVRAKGSVGFQSIKEALPISICGKQLNRTIEDSYDIYVGSPYISSGPKSVAYNPKAKTLTLNDAVIDCTDSENNAIRFLDNAEVTVNVKGDNTVKAAGSAGVWMNNNVKATFQGDGILDVKGRSWGIYTFSNSVTTIQGDLLLKATGDDFYCGIGSNNGGRFNESLVIGGNAVVNAINGIEMLASLTLKDGQQVVEPAGAVVKKVEGKGWGVYESESSTAIARNVVIQPADYTAIQSTLNPQSSTGQWYDLQGRKVKNPSKGGIYIQNGKKKLRN